MKTYTAVRDGTGVFLGHQDQITKYLDRGYSIYEVDGDKETLIATPETGCPDELPMIVRTETIGITPEAIRRMNDAGCEE